MSSVVIATAGWAVPREHNAVGREGSALQRYASVFPGTEINSTFQRQHRPATFERWRESVPESFRFSVKLPRAITHDAALAAPRAALKQFFSDISGLGHKLGPILVQLPASHVYDPKRARTFFRELRTVHPGACACEPRHASWYTDRVADLLAEYEVARVIADPPRPEAARVPAGTPLLHYVRWHGSPQIYRSSYDDARLQQLVQLITTQPASCATWCVFDNTASGAAFGDGQRLRELLARVGTETARPVRIQRSRSKGSRLSAANGLPIVCVSRPSKWGNPFAIDVNSGSREAQAARRGAAAGQFRQALLSRSGSLSISIDDVQRELRGKNLACWCPLDGPCHADVLLELANS